YQIVWVVL
ncbi:hypothetical protein ACTFIR_011814, partial [Dictyostelium discoideum]